jgi:class 3 adenylate cyclase
MNENSQNEDSAPHAAPDASVPLGETITIFFSDIRGFTDYTEREGDETARQMLREYNAIVRDRIESFSGKVVKELGDGFMATFRASRPAILCAIAIQRAVAQANRNQAAAGIEIGIGINTGEPIQEGSDYVGLDVNLASRICAIANPGQILIAETTRLLAGRIERRRSDGGTVEYADRGLYELKGFPEAKRLFEVTWHPASFGEPGVAVETSSPSEEESAAFKTAVQRAIGVLTRVLAVTHLDDPMFPALLECQARASELRLALSRTNPERRGVDVKEVIDAIQPFESLLTLMVERDTLAEDRWAQLDTSTARAFGRPLVNAAARGRLSAGIAEKPPAPAEPPREHAKAPASESPMAAFSPNALALAPPPLDERAAGIRWWAGAYAAWSQWKPSGLAWAHALRAEVSRYPYLLSVHIRASADHEDGQLAGGYFLFLEHVENQSPGFMRTILDRAINEAGVEPRALGPKLYQLLVEGGRLRETYASFVRDVIQVVVPTPGMWADAGVIEHEDATHLISRPTGAIGDAQEEMVQLTDAHEREAERRFLVTMQPLTTRFFYIMPGKLKSGRDIEVRLTADDQPSDRAWYLTLRDSLRVRSDPKLLPAAGLSLPGLGKDHVGAWFAVFNSDPDEVVTYELIVSVKQPRAAVPARSIFSRPAGPGPAR